MKNCALICCNNTENEESNNEIGFHRFPGNHVVLAKWFNAFKGTQLRTNCALYLCSKHYTEFIEKQDVIEATNMENIPIGYGNLEQICRTCLKIPKPSEILTPIFDEENASTTSLSICEQLQLLKLNITPQDVLPKQICSDCLEFLTNMNTFHIKSLRSQNILAEYLHNGLLIKRECNNDDKLMYMKSEIDDHDGIYLMAVEYKECGGSAENECDNIIRQWESCEEVEIENYDGNINAFNEEEDQILNDLAETSENDIFKDLNIKWLCKFCSKHEVSGKVKDHQQPNSDTCKLEKEPKCRSCTESFTNIDGYVKHVNNCHSEFVCCICNQYFININELSTHLSTVNRTKCNIRCDDCNMLFKNQNVLIRHKHLKHTVGDHVCHICLLKFESLGRYKYHMTSHSTIQYKCNQCGKTFLRKDHLKSHERTHMRINLFSCGICGKGFSNKIQYLTHSSKHKAVSELYECSFCGKVCNNPNTLRKHKQRFHKKELNSTLYSCDRCNISFVSLGTYKLHQNTHKDTESRRYKCEICDCTFKNYLNLRRHILEGHVPLYNKVPLPITKQLTNKGMDIINNDNAYDSDEWPDGDICADVNKHSTVSLSTTEPVEKSFDDNDKQHHRKKWLCKFCGRHYVFGLLTDYQRPSSKCNIEEPKCRTCRDKFDSLDEYIIHVNTFHPPRSVCWICKYSCSNKLELNKHMALHTKKESNIICDQCDRVFKTKRQMLLHKQRVHPRQDMFCRICSIKFEFVNTFRSHMREHKFDLHICTLCDKSFMKRSLLLAHERKHTDEVSHLCNICGLAFSDGNKLHKHLKTHKEIADKTAPESYKCGFCDKIYTNKSSWYHHQHYYHPNGINANIFHCNLCDRNYLTKKSYEYHVKSHTDVERKHRCKECSSAFKRSSHLQNHVLGVHRKERPYKCIFCDKAFVQNGDLNVHLRVHNGDKPHKCKYCDESFMLRIEMNSHERTQHTGEKPYQCTGCELTFVSNSAKRVHFRQHMRKNEEV